MSVQHADERNGRFYWAKNAPGAASALYDVTVQSVDAVDASQRLRTRVWNAAGESEVVLDEGPRRAVLQTAIARACGGAILYTADPMNRSSDTYPPGTLELAIIR